MKKTIMLLNSEQYYYPDALDAYLSKNAHRISKIFVFPSFTDPKKKKAYEQASMRIMGFRFVLKYVAKVLWRTILQALPLPHSYKKLCSIESVAKSYQIPVQKMISVNDPALVEEINFEDYEVGLSMVSQIYTGSILDLPHFKLYNFHPSILPRNKGKFPIFWALFRKEKEQGVICHEITKKIDDGQILFQKSFIAEPGATVESVLARFVADLPSYLAEASDRIESQSFDPIPNNYESFYGPTPTKEQIQKYWNTHV